MGWDVAVAAEWLAPEFLPRTGVAAAKMARWAGVAWARLGSRRLGAHRERGLLRERFELFEMSYQFVFRGPTGEVELNHLQSANGWFAPYPKTDEETGNDSQVDLDGDAVAAIGQQMTATQDAFEPAEKELHSPAKTVAERDQLGSEIEAAGRQQEDLRMALRIGPARVDF